MMFHLPYLGMPYYNRYSRYGYRFPNYTYSNSSFYRQGNFQDSKDFNNKSSYDTKKSTSFKENASNLNNNDTRIDNGDTDAPLFQVFGISLYFDDILLICLIWFLYNEGVKDDSLFLALIMLLLS